MSVPLPQTRATARPRRVTTMSSACVLATAAFLALARGVPADATPLPNDFALARIAAAAAEPIEVDWRTLATLNYRTGELSDTLRKLDGKRVRIPGYMVPLEDGADGVNEFLLVPYFGACIHTPPPPPNQIVYVRMAKGEKVDVNYWDPIWMEGDLSIEGTDSPYGLVGHQLSGTKISPYEWK